MLHDLQFYGTGTIGEKGQIVVPAKAREVHKIKPGDNFIFFGKGPMICFIKSENLNNFLSKMTEKLTKSITGLNEVKEKISKIK
jgi:AbrB family looped-hinge helix DNA binding protein